MADIPHTLPWYFGAVLIGMWIGLVALIFRVGRYIAASRAERRRARRHHPRREGDAPRGELTS